MEKEKGKKQRISFEVSPHIYDKWIAVMLEQKITNKSQFFREMVELGVKNVSQERNN